MIAVGQFSFIHMGGGELVRTKKKGKTRDSSKRQAVRSGKEGKRKRRERIPREMCAR